MTFSIIAFISFIVPPSSGNLSMVRGDTLYIRSNATSSGWVISNKIHLRNKRLRAKIVKSGWDNSFSISPTRSLASVSGLYSEPTRLRYCPYGNPRTLYAEWMRNNAMESKAVSIVGGDPFYIAMSFVNDSVRFEKSTDGNSWLTVARQKFDLPGYSLADSFYVEFSAHKTPTGGEMIVTDFSVDNLYPDPPSTPIVLPGNQVVIEWRANKEKDIAGYRVYFGLSSGQYGPAIDNGKDTTIQFVGMPYSTQFFLSVTAYDSSKNESLRSQEITWITGGAPPQEFDKYDITANGVTDVFDWLLLLRLLGTTQANPLYNDRADLTGDKEIDGFDKAQFALKGGIF